MREPCAGGSAAGGQGAAQHSQGHEAEWGSHAQVDLLPEIKVPPQFRPLTSELLPLGLAAEVDSYLATRQPATFLTGLKQRLMLPEHEYINSGYGTKYNVELLNSLVFYVGIKVRAVTLSQLPSAGEASFMRGRGQHRNACLLRTSFKGT